MLTDARLGDIEDASNCGSCGDLIAEIKRLRVELAWFADAKNYSYFYSNGQYTLGEIDKQGFKRANRALGYDA